MCAAAPPGHMAETAVTKAAALRSATPAPPFLFNCTTPSTCAGCGSFGTVLNFFGLQCRAREGRSNLSFGSGRSTRNCAPDRRRLRGCSMESRHCCLVPSISPPPIQETGRCLWAARILVRQIARRDNSSLHPRFGPLWLRCCYSARFNRIVFM